MGPDPKGWRVGAEFSCFPVAEFNCGTEIREMAPVSPSQHSLQRYGLQAWETMIAQVA